MPWAQLTGATKADTAANIVKYYHEHHDYEKDVYDCNNMADDIWDMLKAAGIDFRIVVGSIDTPLPTSWHPAPCLDTGKCRLRYGGYIALETTDGAVVTKDQNALYFQGWYFNNPADVKANDDLRTQYNATVAFVNSLTGEINQAMQSYNNSSSQTEADKYMELYNKLVSIKAAQVTTLAQLKTQIDTIATQFSL